jgi:hypothetical protein
VGAIVRAVKDAGSWWTRLNNDPGFAREMSDRQRSLSGEYGKCLADRRMASEMAMMEAVEHDPGSAGARMRGINAIGERPMAGWVPLAALIRHMDRNYSGDQLKHDLDSVLTLCRTYGDRAEVRKYARARLAGESYAGPGVTSDSKACESCRRPFVAVRDTARFCSATCRSRASRRAMQR